MMSILVLVTTGTAWRTLDSLTSNLATTGALDFGPSLSGDSGAPADGATDILLVGTDSRADAQGKPLTPTELALLRAGDVATTNTDTIILVRIPNDGSSATALSIPRDSYVDVAGLGMGKINGAYGTSKENERARLVGSGTNAADAETRSTELGRKALIDTVQKLTGATIDHYAVCSGSSCSPTPCRACRCASTPPPPTHSRAPTSLPGCRPSPDPTL